MESCIDELAELARTDVAPSQFLGEVLNRVRHVTSATQVRIWRPSAAGAWETAAQVPQDAAGNQPEQNESDVNWLTEAARSQQHSTRITPLGSNGDLRKLARVICPIVNAGQSVAFFDLALELDRNHELPPEIVPFLKALCEITADLLSKSELRQLRLAQVQWQQWDQFTLALMQSSDSRETAATIVNDGRLLVGCDRVTILQRAGTRFKTLAISGVDLVESRSNTVSSLCSLAETAAAAKQPVWCNATTDDRSTSTKEVADHLKLVGAAAIGLIPLPVSSSSDNPSKPQAVIAFEQFQHVSDFPAWKSRAELLAKRSEPLLLAALDRESIPFFKTIQRWRYAGDWFRRFRVPTAALMLAAVAGFLMFWTAEFTVTGTAELVPDHRREIFASSSGIVDQLLVQHGDDVQVDQPLVILRDPQLELELPRITGEIEVVRERLKGVLAVRLQGGTRQLVSEEEELKERQKSLERQQKLVEQQQAALTLKSPIQGKVLTWDVSTLLSARPVERGQALLTIGETTGPWVIEMRIADKDFGHVRRAQKRLKPNLDVDFILASDPAHSYRGTIRDVAEATHFDDQQGISVMVTVDIDSHQIPNPLAGTTAIPRIRCGRQSIGYVWLHDLIDVIWSRLLF